MDAVKKFEETNRSYFQALEQFECDLPDLMKRFENMWVLYSTEGRLCVSKNVGKIDRMLSNRKLLAVECCIRFISKETIEDVEVCFGASST